MDFPLDRCAFRPFTRPRNKKEEHLFNISGSFCLGVFRCIAIQTSRNCQTHALDHFGSGREWIFQTVQATSLAKQVSAGSYIERSSFNVVSCWSTEGSQFHSKRIKALTSQMQKLSRMNPHMCTNYKLTTIFQNCCSLQACLELLIGDYT